ncbi:helix-turn-helix domain-containing protein [Gammaproteobacteria bacterium]|nr:helix-turn-helix domain-containing protein [Gammaproteobacteria bacterium]MDB2374871.1 helix-turn-helix domain-containing protein [Gammaproteobacteria bacterium]
MKEYFLVKDYVRNKPVALVRSEYARATVIAGDKSAEKVFINGDPHNINRKYGFTLLGHSSCHPDIGHYIDSLGPVADSKQRLEKAKQKAMKAKVAKALSEADLVRISELLSNGVSQRTVAEIMGVSQSFIQRRVSSSSNIL